MTQRRTDKSIALLRITVAGLLILHGVARIRLGIVDDFGGFLEATGIPFGGFVAWLLTLVEIVGGIGLASGFLTRPLCVWFALQLTTGIFLVHLEEGWFVVGAGRNGVEYSVLLIVVLIAVACAAKPRG